MRVLDGSRSSAARAPPELGHRGMFSRSPNRHVLIEALPDDARDLLVGLPDADAELAEWRLGDGGARKTASHRRCWLVASRVHEVAVVMAGRAQRARVGRINRSATGAIGRRPVDAFGVLTGVCATSEAPVELHPSTIGAGSWRHAKAGLPAGVVLDVGAWEEAEDQKRSGLCPFARACWAGTLHERLASKVPPSAPPRRCHRAPRLEGAERLASKLRRAPRARKPGKARPHFVSREVGVVMAGRARAASPRAVGSRSRGAAWEDVRG